MLLRTVSKNDISVLLDGLDSGLTFPQAVKFFHLPSKLLSELLKDLVWFGLVKNDSGIFKTHHYNRRMWEKYNRELDYKKLARSDSARQKLKELNVNTDVQSFEPIDGKIEIIENMGFDDGEIHFIYDGRE